MDSLNDSPTPSDHLVDTPPRCMIATLPVELIGRIVLVFSQDVQTKRSLLPLLTVSPVFRSEVERLVYADIRLKKLSQVVKCFETIRKRPHLARYVRNLSIILPQLDGTVETTDGLPENLIELFGGREAIQALNRRNTGRVIKAFDRLVKHVLSKLVNLTEYNVTIGPSRKKSLNQYEKAWYPTDAPFQIRRFCTNSNLSKNIQLFLENQPSVIDMSIPSFTSTSFPLPKPQETSLTTIQGHQLTLPNLTGIVCSPVVASHLVPSRPVNRILFNPDVDPSQITSLILHALPYLAQSSTPIRVLDFTVDDMRSFAHRLAGPLFKWLPQLGKIRVRAFLSHDPDVYEHYISEPMIAALSHSTKLKQITVPSLHPNILLQRAGLRPQSQAELYLSITGNQNDPNNWPAPIPGIAETAHHEAPAWPNLPLLNEPANPIAGPLPPNPQPQQNPQFPLLPPLGALFGPPLPPAFVPAAPQNIAQPPPPANNNVPAGPNNVQEGGGTAQPPQDGAAAPVPGSPNGPAVEGLPMPAFQQLLNGVVGGMINFLNQAPPPAPGGDPAPLANEGILPPQITINLQTPVFGFADGAPGSIINDELTRDSQRRWKRRARDSKTLALLDEGQRSLHKTELDILEKWRVAAPGLNRVVFELEPTRKNCWTWKTQQVSDTGENVSTVDDGQWEVTYESENK